MTKHHKEKSAEMSDYSQEEYSRDFLLDDQKREKALGYALDTRKFEIDLYWKRATYFWAFTAAAFAGFFAIQSSNAPSRQDLSVVLACLGMVFSVGWLCVNRGSKYWQENWENHVGMLEDVVVGPLSKVILSRGKLKRMDERCQHLITGPSPFSVSKINLIISLYVSILWVCLLIHSLPKFSCKSGINFFYLFLVSLSITACALFFWLGRTYSGNFLHTARRRTANIK